MQQRSDDLGRPPVQEPPPPQPIPPQPELPDDDDDDDDDDEEEEDARATEVGLRAGWSVGKIERTCGTWKSCRVLPTRAQLIA
jgi:hypothetical protein